MPARGFEAAAEEVDTEVTGGRVVNRKPVLKPMTELRGL